MIRTDVCRRLNTRELEIHHRVQELDMINSDTFIQELLKQTASILADEIIKQHLPEVLEKISPDAIANMSIAAAGAKINETLSKKIPDKIMEVHTNSTQVYEKGFWGGLRRI